MMSTESFPLRVGVGGPVGSGKTALLDALCKRMRDDYEIAVVTNDIYTQEDAQFLIRSQALSEARIVGVETGGCPHTAIREDASMNLAAIADLGGNRFRIEPLFRRDLATPHRCQDGDVGRRKRVWVFLLMQPA